MNRLTCALITFGMASIITTATHAHNFLSEITNKTSSDSEVTIEATYNWSQQNIEQKLELAQSSCSEETKTCDEIDMLSSINDQHDDFMKAYLLSIGQCYSLGQTLGIANENIIPEYLGPSSFVNNGAASEGHHSNFFSIETQVQLLEISSLEALPLQTEAQSANQVLLTIVAQNETIGNQTQQLETVQTESSNATEPMALEEVIAITTSSGYKLEDGLDFHCISFAPEASTQTY